MILKYKLRSVPKVTLSIAEQHMLTDDISKCPICGKEVYFSMHMTRSNYTYKIGSKYYCGYSHYLQGKKVDR